ncbi:heterokaryon incompatibility protein-domain-containing protein [Immersiella caudata]|uniref:Heterokaryon incompatibility protein-domain-containing protein n=1 Tax=Immersiella caudata TaxID=314043 RepID=A0AA39WE15_9PEZI|nr:heterokaryon incompatibility protein-domain-containing protein [Immersiella caudata]
MRLINTTTIRLEEFNECEAPPYAILSHTWGNQEVTFHEIRDEPPVWKAGYQKIVETCRLARDSAISYAWVDTCCIDKTSSAELSEAINSMFRWYEKAMTCYAFLSDIPPGTTSSQLTKSRWFSRGWTLQELIAPPCLVFYNSNWEVLATRAQIRDRISDTTGICASYLSDNTKDIHRRLSLASIAQRMSWAAQRQTTRTEDLAYCLLGILGINMPLLYGEGEHSFIRLQEEIIRHTNDHSIFAWNLSTFNLKGSAPAHDPVDHAGMLAPTPRAFVGSRDVVSIETGEDSTPFLLTNRGIQINMRIFREGHSHLPQGSECVDASSLLADGWPSCARLGIFAGFALFSS